MAAITAREWMVIATNGKSHMEEIRKPSLMQRTGLSARELRVIEPVFSHPSLIMGCRSVIVVNLEHIRAIITTTEMLVSNPSDPLVVSVVQDLISRLVTSPQKSDTDVRRVSSEHPSFNSRNTVNRLSKNCDEAPVTLEELSSDNAQNCLNAMPVNSPRGGDTKTLPFEFWALEACLESACKCLEMEISALEKQAYPALDELMCHVNTLNLERVRQIKSSVLAIYGRVQKVRDELEHLLDDEIAIVMLHLSEKQAYSVGQSSRCSLDKELDELEGERDQLLEEGSQSGIESSNSFRPNIDELEILLEGYFIQIDGSLNKLSTLREYVDDTKDNINIMLDDQQNQLLQMGIMLTTATMIITTANAIVGIFGINIDNSFYRSVTFWQTTFIIVAGSIGLYIISIIFYKKKGILQ